MAASPSSSPELPDQAATDHRDASGPIRLIATILRLQAQGKPRSEVLREVGAELAAIAAVELACIREEGSPQLIVCGPRQGDFLASQAQTQLQQCFTSSPTQPAIRPAMPLLDRDGRLLSCRSPGGTITILTLFTGPRNLNSEAAWLRSFEVIAERLEQSSTISQGPETSAVPSPTFNQFHKSLHPREVASTIANDSRVLLNLDRVAVLVRRGRQYRTLAVSGSSQVHRRANSIQALERLVKKVAVTGDILEHAGSEELPPQLQIALDDYLDLSSVDRLRIIPLFAEEDSIGDLDAAERKLLDRRPLGAIVLERISSGTSEEGLAAIPDATVLATHAAIAMRNAEETNRIFLLSARQTLGKLFQRGRRLLALAIGLVVISIVAAFSLIQVEHYVVVKGTLQPITRQHLFAPHDGVVQTIHIQHGDQVDAGALVITLQNAELERQLEETISQIQTLGRRLAAVRATRLSGSRNRSAARNSGGSELPFDAMAGEEQQLVVELDGLEKQHALLTEQIEELQIRCPLAGQIVSWDIQQRIGSRPVQRGHQLLTVADTSDNWMLELELADEDVGVVAIARQQQTTPLNVEYALAIEPEQAYTARLTRIAEAAVENEQGRMIVPAEVAVDRGVKHPRRVGAEVRAKVYCGRRSLGASWFSDVMQAIHRHGLFHFRRAKA